MEKLDRSRLRSSETSKSNIYMDADNDKALEHFVDSDKEIEESTFFKKIVGSVQKVIGNKSLTQDDLKPVLSLFKQRLMEKNVALDVADKITESVGQTLIETKTKSFTSVEATVKAAINDALVKILTPKRHIDLVAEVAKAKLEHKPYVVVFIGVNGVGKSTNLAKVAYMLKNSKFSVMLAACDNFRAGAVEQLKVHGKNLDLPVFDKGYKEEPPEIAYQAIKEVLY
jgi:signal recognition particle receptor subunit alpha